MNYSSVIAEELKVLNNDHQEDDSDNVLGIFNSMDNEIFVSDF
jgi:hypothetical protein